jgi:hypothetical protein
MRNLLDIHHSDLDVTIIIRMNVDQNNGPHIYRLIDTLAESLEGEPRFQFRVHLIGKWGGDNDDDLAVYSQQDGLCTLTETTLYGMEKGLHSGFHEQMLPTQHPLLCGHAQLHCRGLGWNGVQVHRGL